MDHHLSRRTLVRGAGALAVGVPLSGWLASCSSTEPGAGDTTSTDGDGDGNGVLDRGREQGYLTVAVFSEPPYTLLEPDGTVTGAEPDVLRAVCKRLGIDDIQGDRVAYESMIPALQAGRVDVIAAGLFMKQSRCAEVTYSEPVIVSTESFGVPQGNPKNITTIQDVIDNPDLKIAVLPGGFEEGILNTVEVPTSQHVAAPDNVTGVEAVLSGRADAYLLPTLSLNELAEQNADLEVTPVIEDAPKTGSGAAFDLGEDAAVEEYNAELESFKQTDEFAEIMEKWGFDPTAVEGVTAEELCQNEG